MQIAMKHWNFWWRVETARFAKYHLKASFLEEWFAAILRLHDFCFVGNSVSNKNSAKKSINSWVQGDPKALGFCFLLS